MAAEFTVGLTHGQLAPGDQQELEGIVAAISGGKTDGVAELEAMVARLPADTDLLGHAAYARARTGDHARALELYDRIVSLVPDMVEARWRRGDRLINLGRFADAEEAYREALAIDPGCEDARMGIRYTKYLMREDRTSAGRPVATRPDLTARQVENRELNEHEYNSNRIRLKSLPTALQVESTTKCNFACKTCSKGYDPYYAEDLQEPIFEQVRRDLMPVNTRLSITGFGEPTLAANFDEILDMGLRNGSVIHFVTNLSLLNYERLERLTSRPVDIIISVDGATRETFEAVRAGGSFDLTLEKLAMIKRLRDIHLAGFVSHFSIHFVALRQNVHELPDVVRLARRYGIEYVGVLDYAFNRNEFDSQSLRYEPELAARWFAESRRVADELGVPLRLPPDYAATPPPPQGAGFFARLRHARTSFLSAPDRFPRRCWSPWSEPYIDTSGMVRPCCVTGHALGDLKRDSFPAIWNGPAYRWLRRRIHSPVPPIYCRHCFHPFGINGGNPAAAMAREGWLVKLFYFLEWRVRWIQQAWRALRGPAPPGPAPNYQAGRPMTEPPPAHRMPAS